MVTASGVMPYLHGLEHMYQDVKILLPSLGEHIDIPSGAETPMAIFEEKPIERNLASESPDKLKNEEALTSDIPASPVNPLSSIAAQNLPLSQNLLLDNEIQKGRLMGLVRPDDLTTENMNPIVNTEGGQISMKTDLSCEVHFLDQSVKKLEEEVENQKKANAQEPLLNNKAMSGNAGNHVDPILGATPHASQINQRLQNPAMSQMIMQNSLSNPQDIDQNQVCSASSSSQSRLVGLEIIENDVVLNKETAAIGVVSCDKVKVFSIDENRVEEFREDQLLLLARSFVHGDRVTDREKLGVIIGVENLVDLASSTSTGDIIHRKIGTDNLERMNSTIIIKHFVTQVIQVTCFKQCSRKR